MVFRPQYNSFFWATHIIYMLVLLILCILAIASGIFSNLFNSIFIINALLIVLFSAYDTLAESYALELRIEEQITIKRWLLKPLVLPLDESVKVERTGIQIGQFNFYFGNLRNWEDLRAFVKQAAEASAIKIADKEKQKKQKTTAKLVLLAVGCIVAVILVPIGLVLAAPFVFPGFCAANVSNQYIFGFIYIVVLGNAFKIISIVKSNKTAA